MVRLFEKWLKSSLITTALIVCLIWGEGILLSINENGITTRLVFDVTIINPANKTRNYDIKSLYCEYGKNRYQATL